MGRIIGRKSLGKTYIHFFDGTVIADLSKPPFKREAWLINITTVNLIIFP